MATNYSEFCSIQISKSFYRTKQVRCSHITLPIPLEMVSGTFLLFIIIPIGFLNLCSVKKIKKAFWISDEMKTTLNIITFSLKELWQRLFSVLCEGDKDKRRGKERDETKGEEKGGKEKEEKRGSQFSGGTITDEGFHPDHPNLIHLPHYVLMKVSPRFTQTILTTASAEENSCFPLSRHLPPCMETFTPCRRISKL